MNIYRITETEILEKLFENWQETMIWSGLQKLMGSAWADSEMLPQSAKIVIADFCFFAGVPNQELIRHKPEGHNSDFIIMIGQTKEWEALIEQTYSICCRKVTRYALKKEPSVFDQEHLKKVAEGMTKAYKLQLFDNNIYSQAISNQWSRDLCSQFRDYEDYKSRGLGVAITDQGRLVAGASSYTVYHGGIEIEIDTKEDYRRKGLAAACGARLILECLKREIYPSWDAQNKGSLALAEKLGYHFDKEYNAYEITGY